MKNFKKGQTVMVPCEIQPGPFPNEFLVTVQSGADKLSGFVRSDFVRQGYILGTILEIRESDLVVRLPGSFFTTASGIAFFPEDWARKNLESARV